MTTTRAIRGMVDVLPDQTPVWQLVEATASKVLANYGYSEIRLPVIENTQLFARSIGESTDIVEKEMYSFNDRNGDGMTLRPEGTAGCVRAVIQHNLINTSRKLWYLGPMFRYERPQKGRQRQFHQIGVETFGVGTPDQDIELVALCWQLWKRLGVCHGLKLEINSLGSTSDRKNFKIALLNYLHAHRACLDLDSQRRLEINPLRILDSKSPDTQRVLVDAPNLVDYLGEDSRQDFDTLKRYLKMLNIPFVVNRRLVRGLDYYNKLVFEWTTDKLGAQGTICGGGRYDGLVSAFGGKDVPAAGFAIGLERLILLMQEMQVEVATAVDFYVVVASQSAYQYALSRIEAIREEFPSLVVIQHLGGGSFKSQFKRADKSGAAWALIYGDDEIATGQVTLKAMQTDAPQQTISDLALKNFVFEYLKNKNVL